MKLRRRATIGPALALAGLMLLAAACGSSDDATAADTTIGQSAETDDTTAPSDGDQSVSASGTETDQDGDSDSGSDADPDLDADVDSGSDGDSDTDDGNDPGADSDADGSSDGPEGTDDGTGTPPAGAEASAAAFSQCMRDQGIDIPDLGLDADGNLALGGLIENVNPADPAVQSALFFCQGSLEGGLGVSVAELLQSQTVEDALATFSQCVRDDGYDVDDLEFADLVSAALTGDTGTDPRGVEGSVDPILALALGLDPQNIEVLATVDGCATRVQGAFADFGAD